MCLALYVGIDSNTVPAAGQRISLRPLSQRDRIVQKWFSKPHVYYVASSIGCGCGFRSIGCNSELEYYEGMFDDEDTDRYAADHAALRDLIADVVGKEGCVELYPVWEDDQRKPPLGEIRKGVAWLDVRKMFFIRGFFYRFDGGVSPP
jgi:hypothetical protein